MRLPLLQLHAFAICFSRVQTAVCPASNLQNPPNAAAGLQGNNSYSYMPLPSVFQGVQDCRLPGFKPSKRFRRPLQGKTAVCPASAAGLSKATTLTAPAICFSGGSRLPFARLQTLQSLPQAFPMQQLLQLNAPAICFSRGGVSGRKQRHTPFQGNNSVSYMPQPSTCPCHLFFTGFKTAVCPASSTPNASAGLSKATTLTATCPCHLFFTGFKTAVCPASNPQNSPNTFAGLSKATTLTATCPCHLFFRGFKPAVCPASNPPNASAGLSKATTLTATCPCHLFFTGFKTAVCPASHPQNPPNASAGPSKATTLTATCPSRSFIA